MKVYQLVELKIKIKSLAAEAKIIRKEIKNRLEMARKWSDWANEHKKVVFSLDYHNKSVVAYEQRHSLLAYAILRNKQYKAVENKCREVPNWNKVIKIAQKFGNSTDEYKEKVILPWIEEAKTYIKSYNK